MKHQLCIFAGALLLTQAFLVAAELPSTGFLNRSLDLDGESYAYQVYVPASYSPEIKWPVVVDLHGKSSGGRDGLRQTRQGLANGIRNQPDQLPIIGLFPQSPNNSEWKGTNAELVIAELETILREFNVDSDRVYLTGSSMGGNGVYHLAQIYPDRFAAFVISCGSPFAPPWRSAQLGEPEVDRTIQAFTRVAKKIPDVPVWIFHGTADNTVAVSDAKAMVSALEATGHEPRYTEYPGKDHSDSCSLPYLEEELWPWLLAIQLSAEQ